MNSQLIFIVLLYFLVLLITHIALKHRTITKTDHSVKKMDSQIYDMDESEKDTIAEEETDLILAEDELQKLDSVVPEEEMNVIKNFDEPKARADLLNYLDTNKKETSEYTNNFLKNSGNITVKGGNYFTEKSSHDFPPQKADQGKMFSGAKREIYSFDPVPTEETELKDNTNESLLNGALVKNKLFNNVEAFDDFDSSYASLI